MPMSKGYDPDSNEWKDDFHVKGPIFPPWISLAGVSFLKPKHVLLLQYKVRNSWKPDYAGITIQF